MFLAGQECQERQYESNSAAQARRRWGENLWRGCARSYWLVCERYWWDAEGEAGGADNNVILVFCSKKTCGFSKFWLNMEVFVFCVPTRIVAAVQLANNTFWKYCDEHYPCDNKCLTDCKNRLSRNTEESKAAFAMQDKLLKHRIRSTQSAEMQTR